MLKEITKNVSYVFFHPNNKENINNSSTKSLLLKDRFHTRDGLYVCEGQSSKSVKIDG